MDSGDSEDLQLAHYQQPIVKQASIDCIEDAISAQLESSHAQREAEISEAESLVCQQQPQRSSSSAGQLHPLWESQQPLLQEARSSRNVEAAAPSTRSLRRGAGISGGRQQQHAGGLGRRKIMRRARKNPTVDRIITMLQDKRIEDDQLEQIQDLQLPLLRKILNVIFISLGVVFLLGVIVVIVYTNMGKDDHSKKN